jgi:acyl-coenzyme A synthetase/AMP-(fatty) acid ligase
MTTTAGRSAILRQLVARGAVVVVEASRASTVWAAFSALEGYAAQVHLVDDASTADVPPGSVVLRDDDVGPCAVALQGSPPGTDSNGNATGWVLYSSGTTGTPTPTIHTLTSLTRTLRRGGGPGPLTSAPPTSAPRTWGLLFEPTRMAGVQVLLQAMFSGARLVDASAGQGLPERVRLLVDGEVDALSATPTLWRQLLQTPAADGLRLRQATLGGETADQRVLDAVARAFPEAHVTHVFASTETGAAFSVGDGRAGFPVSYLANPPRGVPLAVRDGVLHVHSPDLPSAPPDGFVPTGDLVDVVGDRVLFRGRDSGVVNVGGVKVWPEHVESVLREHTLVADALVTARQNAMSGAILTAVVVARRRDAPADLPRQLRAHCAARIPRAGVPAVIRIVQELPTTANGKLSRR